MQGQDELEEIKQLFFEESEEGLNDMETGLLNLEEGEADVDIINTIFRGAHSIKGGAATFAFNQIAEFTHHAETLLDEMRSGSRPVTKQSIDLLLKGVDCIREMMEAARQGEDSASDHVKAIRADIESMLASQSSEESQAEPATEAAATETTTDATTDVPAATTAGWKIAFRPHADFLKFGNKPELLFRELSQLGELTVNSLVDKVPALSELDPLQCYISWQLELVGDVSREDLAAVFDWVDENCELEFTPLDTGEAQSATEATGSEAGSANAEPDEAEAKQAAEIVNDAVAKAAGAAAETSAESETKVNARPEKAKTASTKKVAAKPSGSIRVGIDKIDALLNLVGELVITQSMLKKVGGEISNGLNEKLEAGLSQLESNARELQEVAMNMRMLPINNTFSRFPRMVHDLCNQLGKKVDLQVSGEHTELDKTVLEKIGDPLVHLVRNALDHGVEMPADRVAAGKPETGVMKLSASHEAGNIVIKISDDGAGINPEKILAKARDRGIVGADETLSHDEINHLIFHAGFSTAEVVSDVSGRGVGMDVVRRNIQDLGGRVEIASEFGVGSTFTIRLPLTMAILDGQLVQAAGHTYIVPLLNIVESVLVDTNKISRVGVGADVYRLREQNIPIVNTASILGGVQSANENIHLKDKILVVVDLGNERVGLVVDELLDQQQVVIKSLESNFRQVDGLSGATILGDGEVALILDLSGLVNQCYRKKNIASAGVQKKAVPA